MKELNLTLPWPTSVNNYKKIGRLVKTKNGKLYQQRVNSNQTRKYYFDVYILTKKEIPEEWGVFAQDSTIDFEVYVYLYPPNSCRYDLDNPLKVLLDSLVRAKVIYDDSQIQKLHVEKMGILDVPQVMVKIVPLNRV